MENKDLVIMCQFFYPEYITSALLPYQTATHLKEDGISVDVICGYPEEYVSKDNKKIEQDETIEGINIHRVKYLQLSRNNKILRLINYFSFVLSMIFQLPKIKKYEAIMVYSNPPILPLVAILANLLFGTQIIFVCYDVYPEIAEKTNVLATNGIVSKFMKIINDQLFKRASSIIALSEDMKQFLIKNRNIKKEKIEVIPNWATEEIEEENKYKDMDNIDETFIVTYLGNMGIPQDLDTILETMNSKKIKNNRQIKFIFAGHGNQKEKIQKFVHENNLENVEMHDFLTGDKLDELINKTDAFLVTLKSELLGLAVPSKFYTYLLHGKKIINIMSDEADISKEIKKYGLGKTVANGDSKGLTDELINLTKEYSTTSNKDIYFKHYSKDIQLKKYSNIIGEIVGGVKVVQK